MAPPTMVPHSKNKKSAITGRTNIDSRDGVHFSSIGDCAAHSFPSDLKGIAFVTIRYPQPRDEAGDWTENRLCSLS
jgi:hypothetical protein